MLRLKQAEIGSQVAEEQARLERREARLRVIEKEGVMPDTDVVLKQLEPIAGPGDARRASGNQRVHRVDR